MKILFAIFIGLTFVSCTPFVPASLGINKDFSLDPDDPNAPARPGGPSCQARAGVKAIYGEDDRRDWYQVQGIEKDYWAAATLALMPSSALDLRGNYFNISGSNYGRSRNLCPGTLFAEQTQAAFCSGFLVGEDLVVTAGHCVESQTICQNTQFVFNFAKRSVEQTEYNVDREDVYNCKQLVAHNMQGTDFAVIQLDRPVLGRTPLNVRRIGKAAIGDELMLIGHPSGLPSKIAGGGIVFANNDDIIAGVDAFAGNSGSVVINNRTGLVEGILVAGEPDFENNNGCQVEYRCDNHNCTGEIITPIGDLLAHIPEKTFTPPTIVCP